MIDKDIVDYIPLELEVRQVGGELANGNGEKPELNKENFAKLCKIVTQLQIRRDSTIDNIINEIGHLEDRIDELEQRVEDVEGVDNIHGEVKKIAQIVSQLRVEASELEPKQLQ